MQVDQILNDSFNSHVFSMGFYSSLGACRKLKPQSFENEDRFLTNHILLAPPSFLLLLIFLKSYPQV